MCQFVPSDIEIERNRDVLEPLILLNLNQDSDEEYLPQTEDNSEDEVQLETDSQPAEPFFRTVHLNSPINSSEDEYAEIEQGIRRGFIEFSRSRRPSRRNRSLHRIFKRTIKYMKRSGRLLRRSLRNHRRSRDLMRKCLRMFLNFC